jgi:hypothetical protein
MSIKCPYCGGKHIKSETVRQCAQDMQQPDAPPRSETAIALEDLPSWCYSVLWKDADAALYEQRFLRVKRVTAGRWSGTLFANWIGDDGTETAMRNPESRTAVLRAVCEDPEGSLEAFGTRLGICGHCGTKLPEPENEPLCREGRAQLPTPV